MIQLASKKLSRRLQILLNNLQTQIDAEPSFTERVKKAQTLWSNKGGIAGKAGFKEIFDLLYDLCVNVGICNYCEQSEANDIEHIYPKSFFPENTFQWENYLLACKQCNSAYKLDKCFILNKNHDVIEVKRGDEPLYKNASFINPKIENPNHFMILNLLSYKFELLPGLNKENTNKARSTLDILELNERDTLIQARKSAARHYYEMLERLAKILETKNTNELEIVLSPYDNNFDMTMPLGSIKTSILKSYKNYIQKYQHPSVWYAIKTIESKTNDKWIKLFARIPAAITW